MNTPSTLLYNYKALVVDVNAPDRITALVDQGFRSWTMRQFRLAGVTAPDPRSRPSGRERSALKEALENRRTFLESILKPSNKTGTHILLAPEKPTYAGTFSAGVFMPVARSNNQYCISHAGQNYISICSLMRHVAPGDLSIRAAQELVKDCEVRSFNK